MDAMLLLGAGAVGLGLLVGCAADGRVGPLPDRAAAEGRDARGVGPRRGVNTPVDLSDVPAPASIALARPSLVPLADRPPAGGSGWGDPGSPAAGERALDTALGAYAGRGTSGDLASGGASGLGGLRGIDTGGGDDALSSGAEQPWRTTSLTGSVERSLRARLAGVDGAPDTGAAVELVQWLRAPLQDRWHEALAVILAARKVAPLDCGLLRLEAETLEGLGAWGRAGERWVELLEQHASSDEDLGALDRRRAIRSVERLDRVDLHHRLRNALGEVHPGESSRAAAQKRFRPPPQSGGDELPRVQLPRVGAARTWTVREELALIRGRVGDPADRAEGIRRLAAVASRHQSAGASEALARATMLALDDPAVEVRLEGWLNLPAEPELLERLCRLGTLDQDPSVVAAAAHRAAELDLVTAVDIWIRIRQDIAKHGAAGAPLDAYVLELLRDRCGTEPLSVPAHGQNEWFRLQAGQLAKEQAILEAEAAQGDK